MYRKLFISVSILLITIFSLNVCFANNGLQDVANGVRNIVGGAENAVEDAARNISGASKDATGAIENTANQLGNDIMNTTDNGNTAKDTNNTAGNMMGTTNNDYTATRIATETDTTFMGMNATAWTWLILGIAAIAIIALVWYYSMQFNSSRYNRD